MVVLAKSTNYRILLENEQMMSGKKKSVERRVSSHFKCLCLRLFAEINSSNVTSEL